MQLLRSAKKAITELRKHRKLKKRVNEHKADNEKLKDNEVGPPKMTTFSIIANHKGYKDEAYCKKSQEHVSSGIV